MKYVEPSSSTSGSSSGSASGTSDDAYDAAEEGAEGAPSSSSGSEDAPQPKVPETPLQRQPAAQRHGAQQPALAQPALQSALGLIAADLTFASPGGMPAQSSPMKRARDVLQSSEHTSLPPALNVDGASGAVVVFGLDEEARRCILLYAGRFGLPRDGASPTEWGATSELKHTLSVTTMSPVRMTTGISRR
jgi:hypothetical protein